jgi:hypothetical protein
MAHGQPPTFSVNLHYLCTLLPVMVRQIPSPFLMVGSLVLGALFASSVVGCVDTERPIYEASSRQVIPIPVCAKPLAPLRRKQSGGVVMRDLDPEEWLEVIVPEYEMEKGLESTATDCTGHYVFANETLRHGIARNGWPHVVDPELLDIRSGPRGVKVVRLRALEFENGDVGGPIALTRAVDDRAEIFGIGSYRGPADAKLSPVRMGNETLVVAEAKRCPDSHNCRKVADFYLARRGRLVNAATIDIERVLRVPSVSERGLFAEYHLRTDLSYSSEGVQLHEQVKVKIIPYEKGDRDSDRILRTVEFARLLKVERDTLFSTNESLWERVVGQD